jgi:hypothetical protein
MRGIHRFCDGRTGVPGDLGGRIAGQGRPGAGYHQTASGLASTARRGTHHRQSRVVAIEEMVTRCGLKISDHPARAELTPRYFPDRLDGLMPFVVGTLLTATVG